MVVIKLAAFAGERPLLDARLLPDTAATIASSVRLDDGALTPTNRALRVGSAIAAASHQTIYRHQDEWLSWAGVVDAAPGPVATDRLYYTGDGAPKMRVNGTVYPLALPRPTLALASALSGTGNGDTQSRTYVYTFVTSFGEESAPSPASPLFDWKPGQTVTLSGFAAAPAGRAITKQRIYRSQTGSSGTYFYLIAERDASAANFIDNIAVDAFQEALGSADWNAPPDTLSGLTSMPNGMMAAFSGRDVYFCEAWRPHAWPEKYSLSCNSDVVGLRAIGSGLVVMTKGQPYFMTGSTPDTMQSVELEANLPCINARGIVDLGFAICYPSSDGLVAVRADGEIGVATEELFDRDEWLSLSPGTALASQHAGRYVMFYNAITAGGARSQGALLININARQFLVRSAEYADAVYFSNDDAALLFKRPGDTEIYRFDAPWAPPETLFWQSKEFVTTKPLNYGAIQIDMGEGASIRTLEMIADEVADIVARNSATFASNLGGALNDEALDTYAINGDALEPLPVYDVVEVSVYADGELVRTVSRPGRIERLPARRTARVWQIAVSTNAKVSQILLASSVQELQNSL